VIPILSLVGTGTLVLVMLFIGMTIGFGSSKLSGLAFGGVVFLTGSAFWVAALFFSSSLFRIPFFPKLVSFLKQSHLVTSNDAEIGAILLAVAVLEVGLLAGYGAGRRQFSRSSMEVELPTPIGGNGFRGSPGQSPSAASLGQKQLPKSSPRIRNPAITEFAKESANPQKQNAILAPPLAAARVERSNDPTFVNSPLRSDERIIAELFLFGRVSEISPKLDKTRQGGYYYEDLASLGWSPSRQESALNSLARRGYLDPTPREKVLHCRDCGSSSLEFRSECPSCGSIRLVKKKVIEHFACGMIEKEDVFRKPESGDLFCPKCNRTLELVGSDYRSLGLMYICQDCGALNPESSPKLRCSNCGLIVPPESEQEEYLFAYTLNLQNLPNLKKALKPVETFVAYFQGLGYKVFSPAFVKGISGEDHAFDLLVMGSLFRRGEEIIGGSDEKRKTVVEILMSGYPAELEEVVQANEKFGDVSHDSVLFVIPSFSEKARSYALASGLRYFEGQTPEEILRKFEESLFKSGDAGSRSVTNQRTQIASANSSHISATAPLSSSPSTSPHSGSV
jgi:hypothetical protein